MGVPEHSTARQARGPEGQDADERCWRAPASAATCPEPPLHPKTVLKPSDGPQQVGGLTQATAVLPNTGQPRSQSSRLRGVGSVAGRASGAAKRQPASPGPQRRGILRRMRYKSEGALLYSSAQTGGGKPSADSSHHPPHTPPTAEVTHRSVGPAGSRLSST